MYGLVAQLGLVIVAIVIITTYIQPTFATIGEIQTQQFEFQNAIENATKLNNLLASLVAQVQSVAATDRARLERFMPDRIDEIEVLADLTSIAERSRVAMNQAAADVVAPYVSQLPATETAGAVVTSERTTDNKFYSQDFSMSVVGRYESLLDFLRNLEQSAYPLDVVDLSFTPNQEGSSLYTFTLTVRTYALTDGNMPVTR